LKINIMDQIELSRQVFEKFKGKLVILEDSGWHGEQRGRCIWEYTRRVRFNRAMEYTDSEIEQIEELLDSDSLGGSIGSRVDTLNKHTVIFDTVYDSSD